MDQAEQDCPTTDEIRKKFKNKQSIPQHLIDESPNACGVVVEFYRALQNYEPVTHVVMLVSTPKAGKPSELLGALALKGENRVSRLAPYLLAPLKIFTAAETKEFALNGTTMYAMLTQQLATLEQSIIEPNVTVEMQELVPVKRASKDSTQSKKGNKSK